MRMLRARLSLSGSADTVHILSTNARGFVYDETVITEITESEYIIDSLN